MGMRLMIFIVLSVVLMVLDHREHYLKPLRAGLNLTVAPIQYLVNQPVRLLASLNTNLSSRQTLLAQNASLRAEQLLLAAKLQRLIALENENIQLRALLQSSLKIDNERIQVAQLLEVSTDPSVSELVLNKGTHDAVYEGQPVLDATGIMGQIIEVAPLTSRVLLITDIRSAVPVQDSRNGVRGIVMGQGGLEKLVLTNIPETVDVHVGDLLVSSGLGGRYPQGYPVGVISSLHRNVGDQFIKIEVLPSAQLDRSQDVLLPWLPKSPGLVISKTKGKGS